MDWTTILWIAAGSAVAIAVSVSLSAAIAAKAIKIIYKTIDGRLDTITEAIKALINLSKQVG